MMRHASNKEQLKRSFPTLRLRERPFNLLTIEIEYIYIYNIITKGIRGTGRE
jgi:hypothetical protein